MKIVRVNLSWWDFYIDFIFRSFYINSAYELIFFPTGAMEELTLQELNILKKENNDLKEQLVLTGRSSWCQTTDKELYNEVDANTFTLAKYFVLTAND